MSGTHQNPFGPNQPSTAKTTPGTAGIPNEQTSRIQSFRPKYIFLLKTTMKNAEKYSRFIICKNEVKIGNNNENHCKLKSDCDKSGQSIAIH